MPNLSARFCTSAGGFKPTHSTTRSNSSSFTPSSVGGVSYGYILGFRDLFSDRYIASDESNPGKVLRSLVKSFEILAEGPDIVMEYGRLQIRVMVFCQDHLLLGVGAAYGGTIAVAARDDLSGTDALDPGDLVRMLLVGRTQYLTFDRARWNIGAVQSQDWLPRSP